MTVLFFVQGPQAYETVIKVIIEFNGTCEADNSQFENRFIENLLEKLKQFPVCGDEVIYKSVWLY